MKRYLLIGIVAIMCFGTVFAQKKGTEAYVDMAYILKNLPSYESANEQLTMLSRRWQKEVDVLNKEAQRMVKDYQTEQIFLTEEMKKQRQEEILAKEKEANELKHKYFGPEGELFKKRESLIKPIQDEIYTAIQEIAQEKKYDIVRDRSADPSLIYMSNKLDISDQVLEKLGAK